MPFIRVKSAVKTDPQHEFDVSVNEYEANKGLYAVVDRKPAGVSREATFATDTPKKSRPATKRPAKKPGEKSTAPAGADS